MPSLDVCLGREAAEVRAEGFAAQLHNLADERLCYDALQPVRLTFKSVVNHTDGGMKHKRAFCPSGSAASRPCLHALEFTVVA